MTKESTNTSKRRFSDFILRVYFEDTDCGQIVYHTNYIKYCERARSELFFAHNRLPIMQKSGFVLKNLQADFIASARLGDLLQVRTSVLERKAASLSLEHKIYRIYNAQQASECEELIFCAQVLLAYIDMNKSRPTRIPQEVWELL